MSDQIETKDQNHRHNFEWVTLPGEAPAAARTIRQCSCGTSLFNAFKDLEKQLAERDAALARCVEALGTIELEASMFRVDPPMSEDELMDKFEAISNLSGNTLGSLPASAQAAAKVLAAARWVPCDEQMPDLVGRDDSHVPGGAPATLYSERVLVFDGTVRIDNLVQAEGSPETRTFYVGSRKLVTHWMPLPEPPEAIREEEELK